MSNEIVLDLTNYVASLSPVTGTVAVSACAESITVSAEVAAVEATGQADLVAVEACVEPIEVSADFDTEALGLEGLDALATVTTVQYDLAAEAFGDGTKIETLTDQSWGLQHDAVQAFSTRQPTAETDGTIPVARFNSADATRMETTFPLISQPNTIVVAARATALVGFQFLVDGGGGGVDRHAIYQGNGPGGFWRWYGGNDVKSTANSDTDWHVFVAVFNGASSTLYLDGVVIHEVDIGADGLAGLHIGSRDQNGFNWDGDVTFLAVYDGDLVDDDLELTNEVGQVLADRVGATWNEIT